MKFNSLNRWLDSTSEFKHQMFIMSWILGSFAVPGAIGWLLWDSRWYHATYLGLQILFLLYRCNWTHFKVGLPK